jgi:hypothetical protein
MSNRDVLNHQKSHKNQNASPCPGNSFGEKATGYVNNNVKIV